MDDATIFHVSSQESSRKWPQIFVALSVCYVCICGGNLVGYTSSAIPSIRQGTSNFFTLLPSQDQGASRIDDNKGVNDSFGLAFFIQEFREVNSEISQLENQSWTHHEKVLHSEFVHLTDAQASWIGGLAPLGAFFGSIIATIPLKYMGPKATVLNTSAPAFLISWFITAFAPSVMCIYIGRLIGGLGMGLAFSAAPLYIMDTASVKMRGPLGTLPQFLFTFGVLMSFILGSFLDWRTSSLACGLMVLPIFLILPFVPESPIWLLSMQRFDEAESSYRRIHGFFSGNQEFQKSKTLISLDMNENAQIKRWDSHSLSLWLSPSSVRSSCVAIFLCIFQQLTGINGVNFYAVTIFEAAAGPNSFLDGHSSSIIVAFVFCFANLCSYVLIEKLGRKFLLVLSTGLICLAAFTLGTYFYILEISKDSNTESLFFIPLASLVTFVLAFSIGYGPLLYIIVAEILPSEIRGVMNPIAVGINWLCVFLVAKSFPGLINALGAYGAFWLYGSFTVVSLLFTLAFVPETKGKSDDEIQRFFGKSCEIRAV